MFLLRVPSQEPPPPPPPSYETSTTSGSSIRFGSETSSMFEDNGNKCGKCQNHDFEVLKKGHARECPFKRCNCLKCRLLDARSDILQVISGKETKLKGTKKDPNCGFCQNHGVKILRKGHVRSCGFGQERHFRLDNCFDCEVHYIRNEVNRLQIKMRRAMKEDKTLSEEQRKAAREAITRDEVEKVCSMALIAKKKHEEIVQLTQQRASTPTSPTSSVGTPMSLDKTTKTSSDSSSTTTTTNPVMSIGAVSPAPSSAAAAAAAAASLLKTATNNAASNGAGGAASNSRKPFCLNGPMVGDSAGGFAEAGCLAGTQLLHHINLNHQQHQQHQRHQHHQPPASYQHQHQHQQPHQQQQHHHQRRNQHQNPAQPQPQHHNQQQHNQHRRLHLQAPQTNPQQLLLHNQNHPEQQCSSSRGQVWRPWSQQQVADAIQQQQQQQLLINDQQQQQHQLNTFLAEQLQLQQQQHQQQLQQHEQVQQFQQQQQQQIQQFQNIEQHQQQQQQQQQQQLSNAISFTDQLNMQEQFTGIFGLILAQIAEFKNRSTQD